MKKLALLGLLCGMGFLVAQEPAKDQPPVKVPPVKGEGKRPFGEKGKSGPLSFKKLLEANDKDKDGVLSKEELSGGRNMWERWQKADVNMDNKIDEKEFDDFQKKLMERFKGGKRGEGKKKD
jgi:hypothetical protein